MISLNPGDRIYKYSLDRRIDRGEGRFGQVWIAQDMTVQQDVALKVLDASFTPAVRLLEEARIGNRLDHPNLLKILYADVADYKGTVLTLIAQEYHPRGSVSGLLNSEGFAPITEVISHGIDILRGLEHLHHQGILHNDIKPSNVLINERGGALLTDYGISAWMATSGLTLASNSYRPHAAPETSSSSTISERTDIYQTGLTLFRLINGISLVQADFMTDPVAFQSAQAKGRLPNPDDYQPFVPPSVRRIITRATKPNASDRYPNALAFRRALERLNLRGSWDVDVNGEYVGEGHNYYYRLRIEPSKLGKHEVVCIRTKKTSGQDRRIGDFCKKGLTLPEAQRLKRNFMQRVVELAN
ncbi:MAG TPA: serine/threonine-protein kinase [Thermoanaerobaculia bacterium]|jgi:Serine/threonine protein kinase|nr:serine/threonine-protein kinase [Thermoanaerobaculia bacterium]